MKNIIFLIFSSLLLVFPCLVYSLDTTGIFTKSVDEIVVNPRIFEDKEIIVHGLIKDADPKLRIVKIGAVLTGDDPVNTIYLINLAAKVEMGSKVVVKGMFQTITLPMLGSFLILDAKSVETCSKLNIC
jgi:hypothetical protein